ncbi:MAG: hypothetical protein OEY93_06025 [Anaerolineae bacterium]|nr:hypothetical protein [Anaerolineae bacterium]
MNKYIQANAVQSRTHPWLRNIHLHYHPGSGTPLTDRVAAGIMDKLRALGHAVQQQADENTKVVLTTAEFGQIIGWRRAMMFTGRIQLKLKHAPVAVTLVHMTPAQFEEQIEYFSKALAKSPSDPDDFRFEGLAEESPGILIEQGTRGGPILSLLRLIQAQSKCIRILLVIGEETPERIYHFDLVGACPYTEYSVGEDAFYEDIALRLVTYESTWEITQHEVVGDPVPYEKWRSRPTIDQMCQAAVEFDRRNFFTEMLVITELANVPAINDAIASQYSEGCFATWDPELEGIIATITGSARPVDKGNITEEDLALIVGVRPDRQGALVRHIAGKKNISPSSEAVEMIDMDDALPRVGYNHMLNGSYNVPVIRSKLHCHRGVRAYDPDRVEYVPMDTPYHHYLVSCATEAQARGIKQAFSASESLLDPQDPRLAAFTILPGHGVLITEKWVEGKAPFQLIWEYMDMGYLEIDNFVPQGPLSYQLGPDGRMLVTRQSYPDWQLR